MKIDPRIIFVSLFQLQFVEASDLKDFHLLGLSLGALVSAAYATQHGDRIASLTVMCPPGKSNTTSLVLYFLR